MNLSMIAYIVGAVMEIEAGLMLLPALVGLIYGEKSALSFVICAAAAAIIGAIPILRKPKNTAIYAREGFVATALSWLTLSAVGAVPFCMTGQIPHYINALFEMVSGFTTTGASILYEVESMDHCMLFWRSFSHWIGGMGVLVFMLAILPMAGGQNLHLMRAESPGPTVGKLVPKLRQSAIWLYGIYLGLSIVDFILLCIGGMMPFEALCLTFGTAGTGGFGVLNSSYAEYSMFCKWVTTVFMALFGMNFNFYYLVILRKVKDAVKMEEIRWYLIVFFFASITILFDLRHAGILGNGAQTVDAFFSVSSVMTTTGYATADFNLWPSYSRTVLVMLMFIGACAGSTGGGLKISRLVILVKTVQREVRLLLHPRTVKVMTIDGKPLSNDTVRGVSAYFLTYVFLIVISILLVSLDGFDGSTTITAVFATVNNIGPGLGMVDPAGSYAAFSPLAKVVLTLDMLFGRLELYPMLILMLPTTWTRRR